MPERALVARGVVHVVYRLVLLTCAHAGVDTDEISAAASDNLDMALVLGGGLTNESFSGSAPHPNFDSYENWCPKSRSKTYIILDGVSFYGNSNPSIKNQSEVVFHCSIST